MTCAYTRTEAKIGTMPQIQPMDDSRVIAPTQQALALKIVTEVDLLRLKTIARLHARGLPPDVSWEDLLQEAISRALVGSRRKPEGVTMVAFLAGVMRSLRSEHWRRAMVGAEYTSSTTLLPTTMDSTADNRSDIEPQDPAPDPERALIAVQALDAIERLFCSDETALQIINGLAEGLSAEQIRASVGISKLQYDSTRRRMRRVLLREGLTSCPND